MTNVKVVCLDSQMHLQEDLNFDSFTELCELTNYVTSTYEEALERASGAEVVLVNKVKIDREFLHRHQGNLKLVLEMATGYDNVDIATAKELGIQVCNVPSYSTESVVQNVFAHILNLATMLNEHIEGVRAGKWRGTPTVTLGSMQELSGRTLGIVGLGTIGTRVAEVGRAFGMNVIAYHYRNKETSLSLVSLEELFQKSDYISLHTSLNEQTRGFIDNKLLRLMKPSASLINTARGGLINEADLYEYLPKIRGVGLDVLGQEPPCSDNRLLQIPNCYVTSHIAWATLEARKRCLRVVMANLEAYLSGEIINSVT